MQRPSPRFKSERYFICAKCFTQIYRALYENVMLVPIRIGTNVATGKGIETSVTEFCYESLHLPLQELINIKVMLFLIHELFR